MAEIIIGMAELQKKLENLSLVPRRGALTKAAKAAGKIVKEEASRLAPRRTGDLADNMVMRVKSSESDADEVTVEVGPDKKQFYGNFVEKGTKYMPAEPFLGPALEDNRERLDKVMKDILLEEIEKAAQ
jgi:HK97 gp10 family phage protein